MSGTGFYGSNDPNIKALKEDRD